jgi:23S rRNA (guanine2445-N2)-methyltransferase / 23S rRNA (guanine2069-N7)-methyltransferase
LRLLRPAGRLLFSTNYSRFKLDAQLLADLSVEDISARTIPKDFERNARIHHCYLIRVPAAETAAASEFDILQRQHSPSV